DRDRIEFRRRRRCGNSRLEPNAFDAVDSEYPRRVTVVIVCDEIPEPRVNNDPVRADGAPARCAVVGAVAELHSKAAADRLREVQGDLPADWFSVTRPSDTQRRLERSHPATERGRKRSADFREGGLGGRGRSV